MADPIPRTLAGLLRGEAQCRRCPLYQFGTQVVPGEGPEHAPLMMVGEQPGNDEDLKGHPFVGPAGRLLDRAIADAGLDRRASFVTNEPRPDETPAPYRRPKTIMGYCQIRTATFVNIFAVNRST